MASNLAPPARAHVASHRYRGLSCFQEELAGASDAKTVIGRVNCPAHPEGVLVHHVLVLLGVALGVAYVPAQGLKEWIDELDPHLSFLIVLALVRVQIAVEPFHQLLDLGFGLLVRLRQGLTWSRTKTSHAPSGQLRDTSFDAARLYSKACLLTRTPGIPPAAPLAASSFRPISPAPA
jgi:hypothetical protein